VKSTVDALEHPRELSSTEDMKAGVGSGDAALTKNVFEEIAIPYLEHSSALQRTQEHCGEKPRRCAEDYFYFLLYNIFHARKWPLLREL
jgi:hypothetical protein